MSIIAYTKENLEVALVIAPGDALAWHDVPKDAINPRVVLEEDIPISREFRGAWRDVVAGPQIDICHVAAKEIQLEKLRAERDEELKKLDMEIHKDLMEHGLEGLDKWQRKRRALLDATEPLKQLQVTGYNDPAVLDQIQRLGMLRPIEE